MSFWPSPLRSCDRVTLIPVLSFASTMNIDLAAALEAKMIKNRAKYPAERFRGRFR